MRLFVKLIVRMAAVTPAALLPGCTRGEESSAQPAPSSEVWEVMGTFAQLSVPHKDKERLHRYAAEAKEVLSSIDALVSIYRPESELSRLAAAAGREPVPISKTTRDLLELSGKYVELTGGAFEPTLAPLIQRWGFSGGRAPEQVPDAQTIDTALEKVGFEHLVLRDSTAFLDREGMSIDVGGIGKGYAVDVAYRRLEVLGAADFMVNLGGNLRCRGTARGDKVWKIGIRNPFDREQTIGTVELTAGQAVATSGNYESFVVIGSERYSHILDPRTGYPVKGIAGVTVIAASAVEADAMSTALFVLGPDAAKAVLDRLPGCHALFVPDRQPLEIIVTSGFRELFEPREDIASAVRGL